MKEGLNFSSSYNSKTKKLEQGLTPEELSALENYVSSWSKNVTKNALNEWSEKTLFQKLIYIFVTDYIGEFVDFDPPDDIHFSLEDDDKVNDHIGNLEKKCLKKLIKIVGKEPTYSSFDNFFKDVLNEFFSSLAGIHGRDFHWFKFDRWRNKKIKDFWINKGYIDNPTSFKGIDLYSPGHKQLCERLLENSDVDFISLRYFNPIGTHNSCLIGDCSADKPNNLVPIICEVASGKRESMIIFGKLGSSG